MEESLVFNHFLIPAFAIFLTGLLGALYKKNAITVFICIELMLCASMLVFVAFSRAYSNFDGAVFAFFILAIAAAEVAVGLAIIVQLFKITQNVDVDKYNSLGD